MKLTLVPKGSPASFSEDCYATETDFQRFFASQMSAMFQLALLLNADVETAEECLIDAMRECLEAEQVYKRFIGVWARRAVIRHGIRLAGARHLDGAGINSEIDVPCPAHDTPNLPPIASCEYGAIFSLRTFERLVYVLAIIEGYTVSDCALLLGKPPSDIRCALEEAAAQVEATEQKMSRRSARIGRAAAKPPSRSDSADVDYSCGTLLG